MSDIYSVSEYISIVNSKLSDLSGKIKGEVSGLTISSSGHVYFNLKDPTDESTINCAVWKSNYIFSGVVLEEGMEIIAIGVPDVYPKNGRFTFKARSIEYAGEGELKKRYEKLKKKLTYEGLFDESKKRTIPKFPKKIGVITSLQGAVIHDFQNNLKRHGIKIYAIDSLVNGQEASRDLIGVIRQFKKKDIELLIIMRGGGSISDLAAFDNEIFVREVANFPKPVIAGIGHHNDIPLVSLAADKAESTPTAVAQLLNSPWDEAILKVDNNKSIILTSMGHIIESNKNALQNYQSTIYRSIEIMKRTFEKLNSLMKESMIVLSQHLKSKKQCLDKYCNIIFKKYPHILENTFKHIEANWKTVNISFETKVRSDSEKINNFVKLISVYNPERPLRLGYSIVRSDKRIVKTVNSVKIGSTLNIQLSDGSLDSRVEGKKSNG